MKKVLAAALLCTVSAFATWDYFPVKEAGKGEAKVGFGYNMFGDASAMGLNLGARFSVIEGLEVALMLQGGQVGLMSVPGFVLSNDPFDDATGLAQPSIGVRYWLPMGLGFGVDLVLPFGSEDLVGKDPDMAIGLAVQYSMKTGDIEIGAEVGTSISMADADPGMPLNIGVELDYSLGSITPFVGVGLSVGLTKGDMPEAAKMGIMPTVGAIFNINDMMSADVGIGFGLGDGYTGGGDDMPINIGANFSLNF
ncbi:MAG: hypothetical protein LBB36_03380 [Fibromonadaceae bacterium]|nr:hypothetical protein [Fibromonadaceae bacterium]